MDSVPNKRKADADNRREGDSKRTKGGKKKWEMPRRSGAEAQSINPGDAGIWATCAMNKEAPTVSDLRDLFQEYATKLYGPQTADKPRENEDSDDGGDIEAEIQKELADIQKPAVKPLFTSVKLNTQCLVFFKTRLPVEPVSFIHKVIKDTADGMQHKNCRFVKRLTPITAVDKATPKGLEAVAQKVLAPHFHDPDQKGKKFAIRPTIRNHKELKRNDVIQSVAAAVGPGHKVDLHNYDLLILVEIYQNIVGMSVVGSDYDELKRYNLEELGQAPPIKEPLVK